MDVVDGIGQAGGHINNDQIVPRAMFVSRNYNPEQLPYFHKV